MVSRTLFISFIARAMALGCALGSPARAAKPPESSRDCKPQLGLVPANEPPKTTAAPPEFINHGRVQIADGLQSKIARHAHLRVNERIRGRHLRLVVDDVGALRVTPASRVPDALREEMIQILSGGLNSLARDPGLRDVMRDLYVRSSFVTVRARVNPARDALPLAGLTLGRHHYRLELRSRLRPAKSSKLAGVMDIGTYRSNQSRRGFAPAPDFERPIPGGLTNRGFFKASLVGEAVGDQGIEPVFGVVDARDQILSGTWHYDNDWITLRLYNLKPR